MVRLEKYMFSLNCILEGDVNLLKTMPGTSKESSSLFRRGDTLTIAPIKILGDDCVGDPKLFSLIVGLRGSPLSESTPEKDFLDGIKGGLYCEEVKPPKDDGGELGGEKNV